MITRERALEIVREFIENENLVKHMLAVEAAMRFYAREFGEDEEQWGITALLHDFDWEIHPDMETHPMEGAPLLRERGVSEETIQDILSHADHTGVPRDTKIRKALHACDEITGLITAVALVRPSKSILDVTVKSVKKKWKNLHFAAGANREEMEKAFIDFGVEQWEHVGNVLKAMQGIAGELGLEGIEGE
ncbi:MAG: HDIG domain-containing protein [Anaerolineales bacterium]|jgi:putative nucleotidyltransferase with HDIG domain